MKKDREWSNWSGSVRTAAAPMHPKTERQLADIIRRHRKARPLGAGHSFMPLCETHGALINLSQMEGEISVADDRQSALVPAGWSIARLTKALWEHGLSLANQGDVNPQALAGALATGTHGTGNFPSLSGMAKGYRLCDAAGQYHWCSADEKPDMFEAQRLSLGMIGIATQIQMAVEPAFHLSEKITVRPFAEVQERFSDWTAQHRHAEFWLFPHSDKAIVKKLSLCDPCDPPHHNQDMGENIFSLVLHLCAALPSLTPALQRLMMASGIKGARQGPAHGIFPSERNIRFEEMEYELPLPHGMAALTELISWIRRKKLPVAFPIEYRTVAQDDIWLSPMNQGPVAAISLHQYHRMGWRDIFEEAEHILQQFGGRPHWAKRHRLRRVDVDRLYPRAPDFRKVRRRMDPDGKFLNAHLEALFS